MSGTTIQLTVSDGIRPIIMEMIRRGQNTTPAMRVIGEIGRTSIVKNFVAEGRPTPWKESRRAQKEGGKTLTKTTRLMKSIIPAPGRDYVDIGTNVVYAAVHNFGKEIKQPARERILHFRHKGKSNVNLFSKPKKAKFGMKVAGKAYTISMPKREFMLIQPEDWKEIERALGEYLIGKT